MSLRLMVLIVFGQIKVLGLSKSFSLWLNFREFYFLLAKSRFKARV